MMNTKKWLFGLTAAAVLVSAGAISAAEVSSAEFDALKREVEALRTKLAAGGGAVSSTAVDRALSGGPAGPDSAVTTKAGKLTIGGLLQVWYYSIANDTQGAFANPTVAGDAGDNNEAQDNDAFAIRRAQLKFTMDIHENIQSVVMVDPAAEWGYRMSPQNNQGPMKRLPGVNAIYADDGNVGNGIDLGGGNSLTAAATGAGLANRLLQDAYIRFHGLIPHHEFKIGQFVPKFGWESTVGNEALDFVERAMNTDLVSDRDLGVEVHGFWWGDDVSDARFQYWFGALNGAGNFFGSSGVSRNRADDNDAKDFFVTLMLKPLVDETWGTMELGYSFRFGTHGESGDKSADGSVPVSGLGRLETESIAHGAWASYAPGGPMKGFWVRGEYTYLKDRNVPYAVYDVGGNASYTINGCYQGAPNPMHIDGWFVSGGYNLGKSVWADDLNGNVMKFVKPLEFVFRYQVMQNIMLTDLNAPDSHTDVFTTDVLTAGFNYYIKGHNAKIQFNYNWVNESDDQANSTARGLREVGNDSAVVNFQVAF